MMKTLGLDLGTNSLGWSILEGEKITRAGVLIFEEGINREKGVDSIQTPAAVRRQYRMARRSKFRRRLRKYHTLKILIEKRMCPLTMEELTQWVKHGVYPLGNKEFMKWVGSEGEANPYSFRYRAVHEKLSPDELGRVFYHLAQRRGFKSSRKDAVAEEEGKGDNKELGVVKGDIQKISAALEQRGCTLGEYFYELQKNHVPVRGLHTGRKEHYEKEFEKICEVQQLPEELTGKLRTALFFQRPLRPQRNLVGACSLEPGKKRTTTGHPLFEEFRMLAFVNNIRVDKGDGIFQPLTREERAAILPLFRLKQSYFKFEKIVCKLDPGSRRRRAKDEGGGWRFNFNPNLTVPSCTVTHQLEKLFGAPIFQWSYDYVDEAGRNRHSDYQTAFDALTDFDDNDKLYQFARTRLGFDDAQSAEFIKIHPPESTANYSLCAIRKILPFLRKGYEFSRAVFMAKLPEIFGAERYADDAAEIEKLVNNEIEEYQREKREYRYDSDRYLPLGSLDNRLKSLLEDTFKLNPGDVAKLYRHTGEEIYPENSGAMLPKVQLGMLRNPLVLRSITILRRFVNQLRRDNVIDADTRINIELARTVNDRNNRMAFVKWQGNRQKLRLDAAKIVEERTHAPATEDQIRRYLLWEEQNGYCLYTGRKIEMSEVFNSSVDIEHTIPRSRGGDDCLANNTLCDLHFNRKIKQSKLPSECGNYAEILTNVRELAKWDEKIDELEKLYYKQNSTAKSFPADNPDGKANARQKALVTKLELAYWKNKKRNFMLTSEELGGNFTPRQLVDTGIMTRHAIKLLRSTYKNTFAVNGRAVDWARKAWGLSSLQEKKKRDDHTHHAIDAMVIAALDRNSYEVIARIFKINEEKAFGLLNYCTPDMAPWPTFAQDVFDAQENILIRHLSQHNECKQSFRKSQKLSTPHRVNGGEVILSAPSGGDTVRGALHKETYFGKISNPHKDGIFNYVVRYPISSFTTIKALDKIVDPEVKRKVKDQLNSYLDEGIPLAQAVTEKFWMKRPASDHPGVEIKTVRCISPCKDPRVLRTHSHLSKNEYKNYCYADSGKGTNFMMAIYVGEYRGRRRYKWELINLFDWAVNHKKPEYKSPEQRGDLGEFVGTVPIGAMALLYENSPDELRSLSRRQLGKRLYRVYVIEGDGRVNLMYHREARSVTDLNSYLQAEGKGVGLDFGQHKERLRLSFQDFIGHMLIEGIHFKMDICGDITFFD